MSVAWNDYEVGDKLSSRDTKTIGKRIKKTVGTSAKYCKVDAPSIAALDASRLYPAPPPAPQSIISRVGWPGSAAVAHPGCACTM